MRRVSSKNTDVTYGSAVRSANTLEIAMAVSSTEKQLAGFCLCIGENSRRVGPEHRGVDPGYNTALTTRTIRFLLPKQKTPTRGESGASYVRSGPTYFRINMLFVSTNGPAWRR